MAASSSLPTDILELVYNHIVLPRKLPGKDDGRLMPLIQEKLVSRLIDATGIMNERTHLKYSYELERTRRVLQSCKAINAGGTVYKSTLVKELRSLDTDFCLIVHVVEQNAGLLIRRHRE